VSGFLQGYFASKTFGVQKEDTPGDYITDMIMIHKSQIKYIIPSVIMGFIVGSSIYVMSRGILLGKKLSKK